MPERYLSDVLQSFPGIAHHAAPLTGVEAEIYNRLWRAIIDGKLKPGTKPREEVIGETFAVSRTMVRKVLVIMEHEGIVELPPNRGAYVATPKPEDVRDVCETLRVIGAHIVSGLAAPGRTLEPIDTKHLRRQIALQVAGEESGDPVLSLMLSCEFHILLAHMHGNRILAVQYENLVTRLIMATIYYRSAPNLPQRAEFQKRLVGLIITHDLDGILASFTKRFRAFESSLTFDAIDDEVDLRSILTAPLTSVAAKPSEKASARKRTPGVEGDVA